MSKKKSGKLKGVKKQNLSVPIPKAKKGFVNLAAPEGLSGFITVPNPERHATMKEFNHFELRQRDRTPEVLRESGTFNQLWTRSVFCTFHLDDFKVTDKRLLSMNYPGNLAYFVWDHTEQFINRVVESSVDGTFNNDEDKDLPTLPEAKPGWVNIRAPADMKGYITTPDPERPATMKEMNAYFIRMRKMPKEVAAQGSSFQDFWTRYKLVTFHLDDWKLDQEELFEMKYPAALAAVVYTQTEKFVRRATSTKKFRGK